MKLDQLRYFLEAARAGSISGAARKTGLAQPVFSLHIKALEDDLGVSLFERHVKGVRLTEAGERLYDRAISLLRHVEQVREETVSTGSDIVGDVRIVLATSVAPLLAGQIYWETRRVHPGIGLSILDLTRVASDTLITSRQVDFGLLPNVATLAGAASEPVIAQDLHLVGKAPLPGVGSEIAFAELNGIALVMGGRKNQLRIDLENTAAREGHALHVAIEQDTLAVFRSIVLNGPAYTVVPYSAFATEIEAGLLWAARIARPSIERTLSLVWHQDAELSTAARAVMQLLRQKIETLTFQGELRGRLL